MSAKFFRFQWGNHVVEGLADSRVPEEDVLTDMVEVVLVEMTQRKDFPEAEEVTQHAMQTH